MFLLLFVEWDPKLDLFSHPFSRPRTILSQDSDCTARAHHLTHYIVCAITIMFLLLFVEWDPKLDLFSHPFPRPRTILPQDSDSTARAHHVTHYIVHILKPNSHLIKLTQNKVWTLRSLDRSWCELLKIIKGYDPKYPPLGCNLGFPVYRYG